MLLIEFFNLFAKDFNFSFYYFAIIIYINHNRNFYNR